MYKLYLVFCSYDVREKDLFARFFLDCVGPPLPRKVLAASDPEPSAFVKQFARTMQCECGVWFGIDTWHQALRPKSLSPIPGVPPIDKWFDCESEDQFKQRLTRILSPPQDCSLILLLAKELRKHIWTDTSSALVQVFETDEESGVMVISREYLREDWEQYKGRASSQLPVAQEEDQQSDSLPSTDAKSEFIKASEALHEYQSQGSALLTTVNTAVQALLSLSTEVTTLLAAISAQQFAVIEALEQDSPPDVGKLRADIEANGRRLRLLQREIAEKTAAAAPSILVRRIDREIGRTAVYIENRGLGEVGGVSVELEDEGAESILFEEVMVRPGTAVLQVERTLMYPKCVRVAVRNREVYKGNITVDSAGQVLLSSTP